MHSSPRTRAACGPRLMSPRKGRKPGRCRGRVLDLGACPELGGRAEATLWVTVAVAVAGGRERGWCDGAKRMTVLSNPHSWMAPVRLLMRPITGTSLERRAGGRDKTTSLLPRPLCPSNPGALSAEVELCTEETACPETTLNKPQEIRVFLWFWCGSGCAGIFLIYLPCFVAFRGSRPL